MCDRAAFLHAIIAASDDDLPRLIFADWLDEHGDADRAEFIRLQCAHSLSPTAADRMAVLEELHRTAWLCPLGKIVFRAEFRRGFVEHAVLPATAFLKYGSELRGQTPLRGVSLLGARRVLPELIRCPHLAGLSALHITGGRLGDDGARLLATASTLAGLTTLRIGDNVLADAGVTALAHSPHLAGLRTLILRDNAIADAGAWEIAHSPYFDRLTSLDLSGNEIGPSGLAELQSMTEATELITADQRPPVGRRRAFLPPLSDYSLARTKSLFRAKTLSRWASAVPFSSSADAVQSSPASPNGRIPP